MNDRMRPGVWGVLATPFAGSTLDVDESGIAQLAEHSAEAGVAGLTVLGVFGEAARLSLEERALVLETVIDTVDLPLVVGCSSLATAPAIDEVTMATELVGDRLAGVMIQANSADKAVLKAHLDAINEATGADVILQDYPLASGISVSPTVLASVVSRSSYVCAVKVESPPTPLAISALHATSDVLVFGGLGGINLLDELACGAAGAMTGFCSRKHWLRVSKPGTKEIGRRADRSCSTTFRSSPSNSRPGSPWPFGRNACAGGASSPNRPYGHRVEACPSRSSLSWRSISRRSEHEARHIGPNRDRHGIHRGAGRGNCAAPR